jgi:uncharacterized protein (TIGR02246 family)
MTPFSTTLLLALVASAPTLALPDAGSAAVAAVLDDWHQAAAHADEARYFGHLAPDAVFLGTDAKERWTLEEFRAYVHPHFASGKGWKFVPRLRHVTLANDGATAWFDEILDSAPYGTCRGTGVLRRQAGTWRIEQYALTIPVPNELADQLVALIRAPPVEKRPTQTP